MGNDENLTKAVGVRGQEGKNPIREMRRQINKAGPQTQYELKRERSEE